MTYYQQHIFTAKLLIGALLWAILAVFLVVTVLAMVVPMCGVFLCSVAIRKIM